MRLNNGNFLNKDDRKRLKEILSVLRKNEIRKGISPVKLRTILEDLGPTFVKVGQLLSMRPELIPPAYCRELTNLRTDVSPMSKQEVVSVVEEELGRSFHDLFTSFDLEPIGSASIAQVHRAEMSDGKVVAVKLQRPGSYEKMERDIRLLRRLNGLVKISEIGKLIDLNMILDELWSSAQQELDFLMEANHLEEFYLNNRNIRYVSCPRCLKSHSTSHLLIMEFIDGIRIDDLSALHQKGYDEKEIARKLVSNYLKQILDDHFFHADPHPGNLFIQDGRIIWLDMGMMGRVSDYDARCYKTALTAVVEHNYERMKDVVIMMGVTEERFDEDRLTEDFARFIGKYEHMSLSEINLGHIMNEALQIAGRYKIRIPAGVTMVSRGISTLEGLLEIIAPDVSVISVLATDYSVSLLDDTDLKKETLSLVKNLLYSGKALTRLPTRLSDSLNRMNSGKLKVKIEPVNLDEPLSAFARAARRIASALISAALIIAAAIFHEAGSDFSLIITLLLLAAGIVLGFWTLFSKK